MNTTIATLKRAIKSYPHGMVGLAHDVGRDKGILEKEMDAGRTHKLGVIDAVYMAKVLCEAGQPQCYDFASHVAEECGGEFVLSSARSLEDRSPVEKISHLMRETSDVTSIVLDSMADGRISDNELALIENEVAQAEEVLRKLRQAARAVNAAGKPVSERGRGFVDLPARSMSAEAA
ncbi:MAG: hypothetical protein I8H71_00870 [Xanthomonadaceae bacterium]|nr:hypothetical protein [Xanthomonadaceae bacterium]